MTSSSPSVVRIAGSTHRVEVFVAKNTAFRVKGHADVAELDRQTTITNVASRLAVFVTADTDLVIGSTTGRIAVTGPAGHVAIVTQSGRVEVDAAESADIRSASSDVRVGAVAGVCRIRSTSGRVEVKSCGDADIAGQSGRIDLRRVGGTVAAHSVSGRIELSMTSASDVRAETMTGRIEVSLPENTVAYQPPDAAPDSPRPPGCDCTVIARSNAGRVVVKAR